ncbi:B12-binding domain-containing radical SAM protein [Candidatus Dependentiae bacterium]|nr:B12-binding domain-containing radical SAM protein [Candidatus Dependentiae bacterium]
MKITLIKPAMTRLIKHSKFISWNMEPLAIAIIAGITPPEFELEFFDERVEVIPLEINADLIGITVETFTARRAYELADSLRRQGKKVILGGYHTTLIPDEAKEHADSIVIGEVEGVWDKVLDDLKQNNFKPEYKSEEISFSQTLPDRSIYKGKKYLPISLIQTSRGCPYQCEFCATGSIYKGKFRFREIDDIVRELSQIKNRKILFVDENFVINPDRARDLFQAIIPLKKKWVAQVSPCLINNPELIPLMKQSGCAGLLLGFESTDKDSLLKMNKQVNLQADFRKLIQILHKHHILVYASFIAGYNESFEDVKTAFKLLLKEKVFLAGFSPLTPYPGTPLFKRLREEDRLITSDWWLRNPYPYWEFVFRKSTGESFNQFNSELHRIRDKFYSWKNIFKRFSLTWAIKSPGYAYIFFMVNQGARKEIKSKYGINQL